MRILWIRFLTINKRRIAEAVPHTLSLCIWQHFPPKWCCVIGILRQRERERERTSRHEVCLSGLTKAANIFPPRGVSWHTQWVLGLFGSFCCPRRDGGRVGEWISSSKCTSENSRRLPVKEESEFKNITHTLKYTPDLPLCFHLTAKQQSIKKTEGKNYFFTV